MSRTGIDGPRGVRYTFGPPVDEVLCSSARWLKASMVAEVHWLSPLIRRLSGQEAVVDESSVDAVDPISPFTSGETYTNRKRAQALCNSNKEDAAVSDFTNPTINSQVCV